MLLVESEKARHLRSKILDIVIHTINEKTGGGTKYINWITIIKDIFYYLSPIRGMVYFGCSSLQKNANSSAQNN